MKKGFFDVGTSNTKRRNGTKYSCEKCKLYLNCNSPKMSYTGEGKLQCLIIAEAPGAEEDKRNVQLIGDAGQLLRKKLANYDLDLDIHFWKINAVNCRPPKNRKPTRKELKCCRSRIDKTIQQLKPKFIWLLGGAAVESFYMGRFKDLTINRWRRWCIPDKGTNAWVLPLYHPSYVLRNEHDKNLVSVFDRDLKWAISCLKRQRPSFEDFESKVRLLTEFGTVKNLLGNILHTKPPSIAFDYETTGLKPYDEGHKIWTIAVATDKENSFSFPLSYPSWTEEQKSWIIDTWGRILAEPKIGKVAHNLKFEDTWGRIILNAQVENWFWCTQNTAHILDNRKGITGLKFQAYVKYGVEEYDKDIKPYIKPKPGNKFNTLNKVPLDKLLLYNGMDALLTYRLYEDQKKEMRRYEGLKRARRFFLGGLISLSEVQDNGINTNQEYYEKENNKLGEEIARLKHRLINGKEGRKFKAKFGEQLNPGSTKHLRNLFTHILDVSLTKTTAKGNFSVAKDVMESLDIPFAKRLVRLRKLEKIKGTYLSQFIREVSEDRKLHPFFDLHLTKTYRSSSSMPNFQNVPIRDEEAKKVTRTGILPSLGNQICEVDYSQIEVRIAACYTKDNSLIKYVKDPSTDMHRDTASELWVLPDREVTKNIRFHAKNGWVFPQFYGDWYKSCAKELWKTCIDLKTTSGTILKDHLKKEGITNYTQFEDHCRDVEHRFWYDRFVGYAEWKKEVNSAYIRNGYVETFLGFRYKGYMNRKKVTNYPIQGTAFHCLLWSLIRIHEFLKKEHLKTRIIGQIHDSILFDLVPDEKDYLLPVVRRIMSKELENEFDWIIVPIDAEFEITEVNEPWYYKKPFLKKII